MDDCDFSKLRIYDGKQQNAFEELVCQLAHLEIPNNAKSFVRKRGEGGDGGVECFWVLADETEHAWQAKFFLGYMDASRWNQISDSVKRALDTHPNLKKYTISLPLDRTDSRKKGRSGKQVVSLLDEWNQHVRQWEEIARSKNMEVEFDFWGKHEISLFLQRDDPKYAGRRLYWFNEPLFRIDDFKELAIKSQESLGERYSPNEHVELVGIKQCFDGIGLTPNFWKKVYSYQNNISYSSQKIKRVFHESKTPLTDKDANALDKLLDLTQQLLELLKRNYKHKSYFTEIQQYIKFLAEIFKCSDELYRKNQPQDRHQSNEKYYAIIEIRKDLRGFIDFLEDVPMKVALDRKVLLVGTAGRGKSHLLCDITLDRLKQNLPTVFLLGQHYAGGSPVTFLASSLGLEKQCNNKQILGALDAAGEAHETNSLIIIDAINEGEHKRDWNNHLSAFLNELLNYPNISVILSCRSPFCEYLIPQSVSIEKIEHPGFRGNQHKAATKYLSEHGIVLPSVPFLAEEFTNPLFLKTCCKAMKSSGQHVFPDGLHGVHQIFKFFLDCIEENIRVRKQCRRGEFKISEVINVFIKESFPDHLYGLPVAQAKQLINSFDPDPKNGDALFKELIHEGILAEDWWRSDGQDIDIVRFSFERFTDILVGQWLAEEHFSGSGKLKRMSVKHPLSFLFLSSESYRFRGILEGLYLAVAENFQTELGELAPIGTHYLNEKRFIEIFQNTIRWRSGNSITPQSRDLLNKVPYYKEHFDKEIIDILITLSHEPKHQWNADFLHTILEKYDMNARDAFWSTHVAVSYFEEEIGQQESTISILLKWAIYGDIRHVEKERIRLCAIAFIWFFTSPNRKIRDMATKAAVRILLNCPDCLPELIEKFHAIDDVYLLDRLYAVIFGVVSNIQNDKLIKRTAILVYEKIFDREYTLPHLTLRDYARSVMEYALLHGLLPENITPDSFRPPYKSQWIPLAGLSKEKLDENAYCSIGDYHFEKHVREIFERFSPTPLTENREWSISDVRKRFTSFLSKEMGKKYVGYLKQLKQVKNRLHKLNNDIYEYEGYHRKKKDDKYSDLCSEKQRYEKQEGELRKVFDEIVASLPKSRRSFFEMNRSSLENHYYDTSYKAKIDEEWVKRWISHRVRSMIKNKKAINDINDFNVRTNRYESASPGIESLERKYHRQALRELEAGVIDNFHMFSDQFSGKRIRYRGPWQLFEREIDPSCFLTSTKSCEKRRSWWLNYSFNLEANKTIEDQTTWLQNEDMPPFEKLLMPKNNQDPAEWLVLHGSMFEEKQPPEEFFQYPKQNAWFRVNSAVIQKKDYQTLIEQIAQEGLQNPDLCPSSDTHMTFLGEYPWHCSHKRSGRGYLKDTKRIVPTACYFWEGHLDFTMDALSLRFYLPSKWHAFQGDFFEFFVADFFAFRSLRTWAVETCFTAGSYFFTTFFFGPRCDFG